MAIKTIFVLWLVTLCNSQTPQKSFEEPADFVWLTDGDSVSVGGPGEDGIQSSESVSIQGSPPDDPLSDEDLGDSLQVPVRHEVLDVRTIRPQESSGQPEATVHVQEWLPATENSKAEDDVINQANEVSAPWYDAMLAGLPPSVAYDWRFLVDITKKLKTAPKTMTTSSGVDGDARARLKYLLDRVSNSNAATQVSPSFKLDKHQRQLKTQLDGFHERDEGLTWAWRRAATSSLQQ